MAQWCQFHNYGIINNPRREPIGENYTAVEKNKMQSLRFSNLFLYCLLILKEVPDMCSNGQLLNWYQSLKKACGYHSWTNTSKVLILFWCLSSNAKSNRNGGCEWPCLDLDIYLNIHLAILEWKTRQHNNVSKHLRANYSSCLVSEKELAIQLTLRPEDQIELYSFNMALTFIVDIIPDELERSQHQSCYLVSC